MSKKVYKGAVSDKKLILKNQYLEKLAMDSTATAEQNLFLQSQNETIAYICHIKCCFFQTDLDFLDNFDDRCHTSIQAL